MGTLVYILILLVVGKKLLEQRGLWMGGFPWRLPRKDRSTIWTAAKILGLSFDTRGRVGHDIMRGRVDGFTVVIDSTGAEYWSAISREVRKGYAHIIVAGQGTIPHICLSAKSSLASTNEALVGQNIQTGSIAFDERILVGGDDPSAMAVLDQQARDFVLSVVPDEGLVVQDGTIHWETKGLIADTGTIVTRVRHMVQLASRLALPAEGVPERLAKNSQTDPTAAVRTRNLRVLLDHFGETEVALRLCREMLGAEDATLRLIAAKHLRDDGRDTAKAIAETEGLPVETRVEALRHLIESAPRAYVTPILDCALSSGRRQMRAAAIEGVGALGHREALPRLIDLGEGEDADTLAAIVDAFVQLESPEAEPVLIRWLESGAVPVKLAIAKALGRIGTVASVEPLLAQAAGVLIDGDLERACHAAVSMIQGRLGGVEPGRLSITDLQQQDGALSLVDETGRLSLGEESGRLSVADETGRLSLDEEPESLSIAEPPGARTVVREEADPSGLPPIPAGHKRLSENGT